MSTENQSIEDTVEQVTADEQKLRGILNNMFGPGVAKLKDQIDNLMCGNHFSVDINLAHKALSNSYGAGWLTVKNYLNEYTT